VIESDCSVPLHGSEEMHRFSVVETLHCDSLMMEMDIFNIADAGSNLSNIDSLMCRFSLAGIFSYNARSKVIAPFHSTVTKCNVNDASGAAAIDTDDVGACGCIPRHRMSSSFFSAKHEPQSPKQTQPHNTSIRLFLDEASPSTSHSALSHSPFVEYRRLKNS